MYADHLIRRAHLRRNQSPQLRLQPNRAKVRMMRVRKRLQAYMPSFQSHRRNIYRFHRQAHWAQS